jgi:lipoprotein-releasing system ATP-binding protein
MVMKSRLQAVNVSKIFTCPQATITVLHNVSVSFMHGSTYAITGVSGSGKSTFMHLLSGLDTPTSGTLFFDDKPLSRFTPQELSHFLNMSIGLLFQKSYLIRELSIVENVMLPAQIAGIPKEIAHKHANALLERVNLSEKQHVMPGALSGGQQQRVALARALCNKPLFLLADEPTGSLDEKTAEAITELLCDCQREWGMGLIVSTHDKKVANAMQTVYSLHEGALQKINRL